MNILTSRLIIRNLKPSDLDDFHSYRSNPEITRYQGFDVMSQAQAEEFIQRHTVKAFGTAGEWVQYGIERTATGQLVGDCAIKLDAEDSRVAEIGITISHLAQRNGYAKEVMLGILAFLFEEKQVHRVVELVDTENVASIQLLRSVGFRQEGHFIENFFSEGGWSSEYQYAMLKREWEARKRMVG